MMKTAEAQPGFPCAYGKYQLLARIGQGGMAEIFRARLPGVAGFEKILVIKRLLPHFHREQSMVQMFVNEAKLAVQIQHRNIVQVFELGQLDGGEFYMAMEHVAGTDLRQILRAAAVNSMRIPPWFAVHAIAEILDGLAHAHALKDELGRSRGIVHRDVTPANIFVSHLGDIKLGDFGVAKDDMRTEKTRAGQLKGKVPYMSPEQLYGKPLDVRTDVFAAGVVLWEALTQRRLFGGRPDIEAMNLICFAERKPPSSFVGDIPPELDQVVLAALAVDPAARTQSAAELQGQLLDVLPKLRSRVHQSDVRAMVEVLLGNRDAMAPHGPKKVQDDAIARSNFYETTPGFEKNGVKPLLPVREEAARADVDPFADNMGSPPREAPLRHAIEATPVPTAPETSAVSPSYAMFYTSTGTYAPPRMPPPIPPPRENSHPWPRMPPSFASPPVSPAHAIERIPVDRISTLEPEISEDVPSISDDLPQVFIEEASEPQRPQPYEGPHPFWIRTADGKTAGPVGHEDAMAMLERESAAGMIERTMISATQQRWMNATTFAGMTGQELLLDAEHGRHKELPKTAISGSLELTSVVSLLAGLARDHVTGKLIVGDLGSSRRELQLVDGKPTFVYANTDTLQLPALLVQKNILSKQQVAEMLHWVLLEERRIEEVLSKRVGVDISRYVGTLMKERLADLFYWTGGAYAVDPAAPITCSKPFIPSMWTLLFEMVLRTKGVEELRLSLRPWMDVKLERASAFNRAIADMKLNDLQMHAVIPFGGRTLAASLRTVRDERLGLALAYLLIEADLLVRA